jgi:hypothetical protein
MSAVPVAMQDLEFEHAELLPARETLWVWQPNPGGPDRPVQPYTGPVQPNPGGPDQPVPGPGPTVPLEM